jgi:NADPH:quinone reductase-like Zn-dependent oxidoreductase
MTIASKPGQFAAIPALILSLLATSVSAAAGTMRAAVLVDGGIQIQTVPEPEPKAGEVRIKVRAASVNPVDWKAAARAAPGARSIPGRDVSGTVDAAGDPAGPWKTGREVIAIVPSGGYAEYVIAPVTAVAAKPARVSFEEAAGAPVVGETAWRSLVTVANVQPGQRVLIHGAAGGVGSSAVQIAKARGAYVIATASPRHNSLLRSLGADEVIDYNSVRFEDKVSNVDVVLNTVDAETGIRSLGVLKPGGILVSVVGLAPAAQCEAAKVRCAIPGPVTGEMLGAVSALVDQGKFRVTIDELLPLDAAAQAWDDNRKGHTGGKIVLQVSR